MTTHKDIFALGENHAERAVPIRTYLDNFNSPDETYRDNVAGALEKAVGDTIVVNTAKDERLGRMFSNRVVKFYPAFADLYGLEDTIQTLMKLIGMAASGYPQGKMLFYLHGLPSSGKTTLAERLLKCFERAQIWTLAVKDEEKERYIQSPISEHQLGLFNVQDHGAHLEPFYKIPRGRLQTGMSPWAAYHLQRLGTREKFFVTRITPWGAMNTCITTADFSAMRDTNFLVGYPGKEFQRRNYVYKGAFNRTTQGILELVEIFKADPKLLKALLTATQDRWYVGSGGIGRLPYQGLLLSYSNTDDWKKFQELPAMSGFMSRVLEIPVPLPTSISAEMKILQTVIRESGDKNMPIAPGSIRVASVLTVASRLDKTNRDLKLRVYNGDHPGKFEKDRPEWSEEDKRKMNADDLRRRSGYKEGLEYGLVIRQIQKWLPQLADSDPNGTQELAAVKEQANLTSKVKSEADLGKKEVGLDPVSLLKKLVLITERECKNLALSDGTSVRYIIEQYCVPEAESIISLLVRRAYPDDFNKYMRDRFGWYFTMLDNWLEDRDYKDPDSDREYNNTEQQAELSKLEKPLGIADAKDFRGKIMQKVHPFRDDFLKSDATPWQSIDPDLWFRIEEVLLPPRDKMLPSDTDLKDDPKLWSVDYQKYRDTKYRQECHAKFVQRFIKLCKNDEEGTSCTLWQAQRMIQWWVDNCAFSKLL